MKRSFIFLIFLLKSVLLLAEGNLLSFYQTEHINYESFSIVSQFFLSKCDERGYEDYAYAYKLDENTGFSVLKYYPSWNPVQPSFFKLNEQKFEYFDFDMKYELDTIYKISYKDKKYLIIYNYTELSGLKRGFIFDITDLKNIKFYSFLNYYFNNNELDFFPIVKFNNQLCFFVYNQVNDWNGEYYLCPYIIENDKMNELIDKNGKQYRLYFNYMTKPEYIFEIIKHTF